MTTPPRPALPDWLDLSGQVGVVTGGGTHLGLAMARAVGTLGMRVVLVGRRAEVVETAAAALRDEGLAREQSEGWSAA